MAELPFPEPQEQPGIAGPDPQTLPTASGPRRAIVGVAAAVVVLIVMGFLLFGGRAARKAGQAVKLPAVDATPVPAQTHADPFKGMQTDYSRLMEPPARPPEPIVPSLMPQEAPQPPAAHAPYHPPPARGGSGRPTKERKVLVVKGSGGRRAEAQEPIAPGTVSDTEGAPADPARLQARPTSAQEGFQAQAGQRIPETMQDRLHSPESPYVLLAGDYIPAVLLPGIHSDLPNSISAMVTQDIRDSVTGRHLLIPQGSRLFGVYDSAVVYGQDRVLIAWQRLRLPNGDSLQLEAAPGVDVAGYAGLKDKVNTHFWGVLRAVLLSSVLSIGSRSVGGDSNGDWPSVGQQVAHEVSRGVNQAGQRIVDRELARKPTITIRPGMRFNVLAHRDIVLKPWDTARGTYGPQ